jgi:tetratricopeptide (TPR) repeat protein
MLRRLLAGLVVVAVPLGLMAQEFRVEVQATGEHRLTGGDTLDFARLFARADAQRNLVRVIAKTLLPRRDLTALKLIPVELDAYVAALIDTKERPAANISAAATSVRVDVVARFDPAAVVQRMASMRRDPDAARAVVTAWMRSEEIYERVAEQTRRRAGMRPAEAAPVLADQIKAITEVEASHIVARGTAALAHTELSTIGGRIPAADGRQRAKEHAEAAIALVPDSAEARTLLGDWFIAAEQPALAEVEYRRAVTSRANSAPLRTKLAEALRLQGNFAGSVSELREAFRIDPTFAQAHSDLAMILRAEGKVAEAETEYREAVRLDPKSTDARNGLAITLAGTKRLEEALAEFQAILAIDPESTIGYYNMATVLANLDRDVEAATALREVVRINPNHYNARYNLGELLRLDGKFDDSATQFREYLRLAPDTPENRRNINRARQFVEKFTNP